MTTQVPPNSFSEQVRRDGGIPMLFEVIPSRRDASKEKVAIWRDRILAVAQRLPLDGLNIPEVRDEDRSGERTYSYAKRMKPRDFGKLLCDASPEPLNLVMNRVMVYRPVAQQMEWLQNSHVLGVRNLILVGGESSRVTYSGPSVEAAARLVTEEFNSQLSPDQQFFCGGITIPNRRRSDPERDEPGRLLAKVRAGIEFFSSQVIYEADQTCRLLADYADRSESAGLKPKRIFLSFAPVGRPKHVEFMRWLGVEVPPGTEAELLDAGDEIGAASIQICARIFQQILAFVDKEKLPVSLGLNISPLMHSNFDLGIALGEKLASVRP